MNFGIAIETDLEANKRAFLVQRISDFLGDFLKDKSFGEIQNIHIGIICQRPVPGFEAFQKKRKPKYVSSEWVQLLNGDREELRNTFSYDVKLDASSYESFVGGTEAEAMTILIKELLESLSNFDVLPRKIKSFDVSGFKTTIVDRLDQLKGEG